MPAAWLWLLACQGGPNDSPGHPHDTAGTPTVGSTGSAAAPPSPKGPTPEGLPVADTWQLCDPEVRVPWDGTNPPPPPDPDQAVVGASPAPEFEHLGWPSWDPSTSISFVWRTDVDTLESEVSWGTSGFDHVAEGKSYVIGATLAPPGTRIHEVRLCGQLSPSTQYQYRVGGPDAWSAPHTFTSAPPPGSTAGFRFAFLGDSRGPLEIFAELLAEVDAEDPDFILFGGDAVASATNLSLWDGWFSAAGDVIARRPFISAHGNHEALTQDYFAQVSLPGNEQWFGIRYGNLSLAVLNDTLADADDLGGAEVDLLDAVFTANPTDFKVVMHHQDEYATCSTHASNLLLRQTWAPVYDAHKVALVLQGHNHAWERSVPIAADAAAADGQGVVYVVSGGAGAPLYKHFDVDWFNASKTAVYHYMIADVFADRIDATTKDIDGNVIDTFSIPLR